MHLCMDEQMRRRYIDLCENSIQYVSEGDATGAGQGRIRKALQARAYAEVYNACIYSFTDLQMYTKYIIIYVKRGLTLNIAYTSSSYPISR